MRKAYTPLVEARLGINEEGQLTIDYSCVPITDLEKVLDEYNYNDQILSVVKDASVIFSDACTRLATIYE